MTNSFHQFFSSSSFEQKELFKNSRQLWEPLNHISSLLQTLHFPTELPQFKNVVISGNVLIGKNVSIAPFVLIEGPVVIGDCVQISHGAYIRPNTILNDGVKIGHGAEVKASLVGKGAKIAHLSYVGDSIIGKGVSLAAHTVCANQRLDKEVVKVGEKRLFSSRKKLGAIIGDNVSVGCKVTLNPGTTIKKGCRVINKQQLQYIDCSGKGN